MRNTARALQPATFLLFQLALLPMNFRLALLPATYRLALLPATYRLAMYRLAIFPPTDPRTDTILRVIQVVISPEAFRSLQRRPSSGLFAN